VRWHTSDVAHVSPNPPPGFDELSPTEKLAYVRRLWAQVRIGRTKALFARWGASPRGNRSPVTRSRHVGSCRPWRPAPGLPGVPRPIARAPAGATAPRLGAGAARHVRRRVFEEDVDAGRLQVDRRGCSTGGSRSRRTTGRSRSCSPAPRRRRRSG